MFKRTMNQNVARLASANLATLSWPNTISVKSGSRLRARRDYSKGGEIFLLIEQQS